MRTRQSVLISAALLVLAVALGLGITRHYGESWDELKFYKYAESALQAYGTWPVGGEIPITGNTYDNYGPAYVMLVDLAARGLGLVLPWTLSDLRHLLYFFTFLAGVWALYVLCRRWLSTLPALGATALFAAQPLFWGHAFISPKDIPFLTFFLLSLESGFRMVEAFEPPAAPGAVPADRRRLWLFTGLWAGLVFVLFAGTGALHAWLAEAVRGAAAGEGNFIAWIASDVRSADPQIYIQRYFAFFIQGRAILFWLGTAILGWYCWRTQPAILRALRSIALPAALLGLTTCIRVLGPLAALIVALYAWRLKGKSSIPLLAAYGLIAFVVMYATWPYLWPDPLARFLESAVVMARYPWRGQVLFDGVMYESTGIPRHYLPVLLGIQLTEPVWALCAAGLAVTLHGAARRREASLQLLALSCVWLIVPLLTFVGLRSPLYDNFRQVFFILPPVFLLAGVAFEQVRSRLWQGLLIALVLLPGVVDGLRLHPYEYIYYNRFVGGVNGALRRFELDYWGVSYRAAADYLNQHAGPDANVWVEGPAHLLDLYARPDLNLYSTYEAERAEHYDYVVAVSRYNLDQHSYPEAAVVHAITRDGAVLTVIKKP